MESATLLRAVARLCALLLIAEGILVCIGWATGHELLIKPKAGSSPVAIYTAIALIIVGTLLLTAEAVKVRWVRSLRRALALLMVTYCVIAIVETVFQFDLGIEPHSLSTSFNSAFRWPGRMAPSTAFCFLLLGIAFLVQEWMMRERAEIVARALAWIALIISGASLIGFITRIEFLYSWGGITSMALPAAAGLHLACWATLASPALNMRQAAAPAKRIVGTASILLVMTAGIAGLVGFTLSQQEVERSAASSMALRANAQRQLFDSILEHRFERATVAASSIPFLQAAAAPRRENHAAASAEIHRLLAELLDHGFSYAALESEQGVKAIAAGSDRGPAQITIPIRRLAGAQLIWRNGFALRTRIPVPGPHDETALMVAEQTLPVLTESALKLNRWGESGDTVICAGDEAGGLQCFPDRVTANPFHLATTIHGQPLPMSMAIDGYAGQTVALDYRGVRVMADYGPVGNTGLGLVLKMDTDELYAPIRHQFVVIAPTLTLVIAGAVWLVRRRVRPLVQQLRDNEEKAHVAQRAAESASAAKSNFLAMMSHEIRTPMNVIMGMTQLASLQSPSPKIAEYLTKIDGSAKNLLGIINDVLDFSKIEAGSMALESVSFRWADVADALMSMAIGLKHAKVEFQMEEDPAIPAFLLGDRMRLQQILINLLANAFKFTESGSVSLRVAIAERQAQSILLEAHVADTGIGISPDQQQLLFSPFMQADNSTARRFGGTGLGLAICKRLAEMMGGSLTVDSALGRGSCFTLSVPLAIATTAPARPKVLDLIARHSARLRGVRVLIAEDQRLNQEVICGLLRAFGMDITVANDGADAIRRLADTGFDIVLMDIQMPGVDGLEATRTIRKTHDWQSLPIIAMTADAFSDVRQQCYAAGMNDHVSKPFELEQLINVIGHWTGRDCIADAHPASIGPQR